MAVNTTLSASFSAMTALALAVILGDAGDIGPLLNGVLAVSARVDSSLVLALRVILGDAGGIGPLLNGGLAVSASSSRRYMKVTLLAVGSAANNAGLRQGPVPKRVRLSSCPCAAVATMCDTNMYRPLPPTVPQGAVSITAGCAYVQSYAAVAIGVVAGFVYTAGSRLLIR